MLRSKLPILSGLRFPVTSPCTGILLTGRDRLKNGVTTGTVQSAVASKPPWKLNPPVSTGSVGFVLSAGAAGFALSVGAVGFVLSAGAGFVLSAGAEGLALCAGAGGCGLSAS